MPVQNFIWEMKNIRFSCEYLPEENGNWSCWTDQHQAGAINTFGHGSTLGEAVDDYVDALKEIAEAVYRDDLSVGEDISAEYLMKILLSSKEEIKSCLDGRICADS